MQAAVTRAVATALPVQLKLAYRYLSGLRGALPFALRIVISDWHFTAPSATSFSPPIPGPPPFAQTAVGPTGRNGSISPSSASECDLTDVRHLIIPHPSQSSPDMRTAKVQRSISTYSSQAVMTATAVPETYSPRRAQYRATPCHTGPDGLTSTRPLRKLAAMPPTSSDPRRGRTPGRVERMAQRRTLFRVGSGAHML